MRPVATSFTVFFVLLQTLTFAQNKEAVVSLNYPEITAKKTKINLPYSLDPLASYRWKDPKATDGLEIYRLSPIDMTVDRPEQVEYVNSSDLVINGVCDIGFDFGQVNAAWFEFESPELDGDVELSISEFNQPAVFNVGSQNPKKTARPVKIGNTYRLQLNDELYEGVRFAWIHVKAINGPIKITSPRLVCQVKPTNYEGSFETNDTMLNRIWYTGAYTVKLNLLKDHFGAILMERSDRHSWTGDAHTSQAASMVSFGNYDFVKQNLRYTSEQYNGIASYSLYWVLSLMDYYRYTGDQAFLNEMLENAKFKLRNAYEHYGKNEPLLFYGWDERLGAGFENPNCAEAEFAYKMLSIRSWKEFSEVLSSIGDQDAAQQFAKYANEKISQLNHEEHWWKLIGVHAAADAINTTLMDNTLKNSLWENAFSNRLQRLSYSPFNQFFILQAMSKMGKHTEALTTIDDCWGGQVRYGGTTFFEVYRPSWNSVLNENDAPINNQCGYTSLTHPWSSGVTKWLTEEILGIKPTSPGFEIFSVQPYLSSKITSVKGDVPTLNGKISFSIDMDAGTINLTVPSGTVGNLRIPKPARMTVITQLNGIAPSRQDDAYIYFDNIASGSYAGTIAYDGKFEDQMVEELAYDQTEIATDTLTKGSWKGKYGSKGHYFFHFDKSGRSDSTLPSHIKEIKLGKAKHINWVVDTDDGRALTDHSGKRNLGAIYTNDPYPCMQTMTIDVYADDDDNLSSDLSLYFVDFDHAGRRSALEIFDLETLELLSPVYIIDDYKEGKYVTFPMEKSVRIRINQVRGVNAVCSGIFFD